MVRSELFVRLSQVNNTFNQTKQSAGTAGNERNNQLKDTGPDIAKIKLVNAKTSEQNAQNAGDGCVVRFVIYTGFPLAVCGRSRPSPAYRRCVRVRLLRFVRIFQCGFKLWRSSFHFTDIK